jgi:aspartate carbamoyltransferase catalytic subunit
MTCVAVMAVLFVVPSTRTDSPFVMALAEVDVEPLRYVVDDASVTVTF